MKRCKQILARVAIAAVVVLLCAAAASAQPYTKDQNQSGTSWLLGPDYGTGGPTVFPNCAGGTPGQSNVANSGSGYLNPSSGIPDHGWADTLPAGTGKWGQLARRYAFTSITSGTYDVYITWPTPSGTFYGAASPVVVTWSNTAIFTDGSGRGFAQTTVNQSNGSACPADVTVGGRPFKRVFTGVQCDGSYLDVVIANEANKGALFDAVHLIRTGP